MIEHLWWRVALLVVGTFSYIGIGYTLAALICKSKRSEFGPNFLWLYFWPLPVIIMISAIIVILATIAMIVALVVGFVLGMLGIILGFAGGFVGICIVLVVILSPLAGFDLFLDGIKKMSGYLISRHKTEQAGHKEKQKIEKHQT